MRPPMFRILLISALIAGTVQGVGIWPAFGLLAPQCATASDWPALVAAAAARPDDDTARLAIADYLADHGQTAWAELIREEIEFTRRWQIGTFDVGPGRESSRDISRLQQLS